MACPARIELTTPSLEGWCSIRLSYGQNVLQADAGQAKLMVGVQGFEPWTPWSQTRCATGLRHTPNNQYCSSIMRMCVQHKSKASSKNSHYLLKLSSLESRLTVLVHYLLFQCINI
jgi:hypothetical protein